MNKILWFFLLFIYACASSSVYPDPAAMTDFHLISNNENCGKSKSELANLLIRMGDMKIYEDHINIKYNYDGTTKLKFKDNRFISAKHSWRAFSSPYPALQYGSINLINCP